MNTVHATQDPVRHMRLDIGGVTTPVQLCLSPHCTTLASLIEGAPTSQWPRPTHRGWAEIVTRAAGALDYRALAPYTSGQPLPPFLTSALTEPAPTFQSQLDEIAAVSPDVVSGWLQSTFGEDVPRPFREYRTDPGRALANLSISLRRYFDLVVAPLWPAIRGFLDREIMRVGYLLATRPASVVLSSLHPAMRLEDGALVIQEGHGTVSGPLDGRRLKLTPLASVGSAILVDFTADSEIKVGYAAPGVEELWSQNHAPALPDALAGLLGETRARVLAALETADSTTTLSQRLRLPSATVSGHLAALNALGLIERVRVGRRVYYHQTPRGRSLISVFATQFVLPQLS